MTHTRIKMETKIVFVILISLGLFLGATTFGNAEGEEQIAKADAENVIKEKQVLEINKNLKNAIEQNQQLTARNQELEQSINQLRVESSTSASQSEAIKAEQAKLDAQLKEVQALNRQYSQEIERLEVEFKATELAKADFSRKAERLEDKLLKRDESDFSSADATTQMASVTKEEVKEREDSTMDLLSRIDAFTETDERLRADTAKAHYNMGNIYFEKGEYEIAAREYYQAVTLMPDDADAHYNLAYVSGNYLKDFATALKHYRQYLYLNPDAKDSDLVKEKILEAELVLKGKVDSPLEKDSKF